MADKKAQREGPADPEAPRPGVPRKKLTSGQLRAAAKTAPEEKAPPAPPADTRLLTVERWARGRVDPVTIAFVSVEKREHKAIKRTPAEWMTRYKDFLTKPR